VSAAVSAHVLAPTAEAHAVEPTVTATALAAPATEVRPVPAPVPSVAELRPTIGSVRRAD
jgi:hypothetical protein